MTARLIKNVGAVLFSAALVTGISMSSGAGEMESTTTKVPGGAMVVDSIKTTATIKAIDKETRDITLKTEDGRTETLTAGPAVVNFDQLAVGDKVNAKYTEAVAIYLGKDAEASVDAAGVVALAPKGGTPGGAVAGVAQVTAKITELDAASRHVTLQLPDDTTQKLKVREGIDLSKVAVGDSVTIAVTKGLAIDVEKP